METSNNVSTISQSTCLKMRELIQVIGEYMINRTDSSALLINKFLQAYSVSIDVSVFEPESSLGAQFYVKLYELFSTLEPQSQMAWNCVDVLCNACRNSSARQALITEYHFVPTLSKMLDDSLNVLNKKKLLILLQDLTCGIKLSWQISHLPHLLKTLHRWIEDKNSDIVCLSLGVIVNLCFKNPSAIYTLSRIVDIKKLLRFCLPLQGPIVEIHVCKLLVILNHLSDDIPWKTLLNLVTSTFKSVQESLTINDSLGLRSIVDFFVDMVNNENVEIFKKYCHYIQDLECLFEVIDSRKSSDPDATPLPPYNAECMAQILRFIYTLELNKLVDLSTLYERILKLCLEWITSDKVSYQAHILLTLITQHVSENDSCNKAVLKILTSKLQMLLTVLQNTSTPVSMDDCNRLASSLQLLRMMLKSNVTYGTVLNGLSVQLVNSIFIPVLSDDHSFENLYRLKINDDKTATTAYVDAYVYAVCLVYEVAQHDARWLEMLSMLMERRNIQVLLALALSGSNGSVKQLVLELSKNSRFPTAKVATMMESVQNMFCITKTVANDPNSSLCFNPVYPSFSYSQIETLDDILKNIKDKLIQDQSVSNIPTSQIMELYEYRLTSLTQSEISAANSLQAASDRCVHLQHRLAQISTEHNKLGQLLHNYEKRLEKSDKDMSDLKNYCLDEKKRSDVEIAKREKFASQVEQKVKEVKAELSQVTAEKRSLEEQQVKLENLIQKLEENGNRVEKQLETREDQLKNANSHIDGLNVQVKDLRAMLEQKETKLADINKRYMAQKEIMDAITKMAASQNAS